MPPPKSFNFIRAGPVITTLLPSPRVSLWWSQTVVSQFKDRRRFNFAFLQIIVDNHWRSCDSIQVTPMIEPIDRQDMFLFHCNRMEDKYALLPLGNVVILGALLVLQMLDHHRAKIPELGGLITYPFRCSFTEFRPNSGPQIFLLALLWWSVNLWKSDS